MCVNVAEIWEKWKVCNYHEQKITKYCTLKSRKTLACFNPFKIKLLCAVGKIFSLPIINNRVLIIGTYFFW